jgi:hypothetical protein
VKSLLGLAFATLLGCATPPQVVAPKPVEPVRTQEVLAAIAGVRPPLERDRNQVHPAPRSIDVADLPRNPGAPAPLGAVTSRSAIVDGATSLRVGLSNPSTFGWIWAQEIARSKDEIVYERGRLPALLGRPFGAEAGLDVACAGDAQLLALTWDTVRPLPDGSIARGRGAGLFDQRSCVGRAESFSEHAAAPVGGDLVFAYVDRAHDPPELTLIVPWAAELATSKNAERSHDFGRGVGSFSEIAFPLGEPGFISILVSDDGAEVFRAGLEARDVRERPLARRPSTVVVLELVRPTTEHGSRIITYTAFVDVHGAPVARDPTRPN